MPDVPALRLIRVGQRGFNLAQIAGWDSPDERVRGGSLRVYLTGGEYLDFEGCEARAVRWHLETQAKELRVDRDPGQRAEPVEMIDEIAGTFAIPAERIEGATSGIARLAAQPPAHGARPDPKPDAVLAASAADWTDPDHDD